jgi:hypothetical protein
MFLSVRIPTAERNRIRGETRRPCLRAFLVLRVPSCSKAPWWAGILLSTQHWCTVPWTTGDSCRISLGHLYNSSTQPTHSPSTHILTGDLTGWSWMQIHPPARRSHILITRELCIIDTGEENERIKKLLRINYKICVDWTRIIIVSKKRHSCCAPTQTESSNHKKVNRVVYIHAWICYSNWRDNIGHKYYREQRHNESELNRLVGCTGMVLRYSAWWIIEGKSICFKGGRCQLLVMESNKHDNHGHPHSFCVLSTLVKCV